MRPSGTAYAKTPRHHPEFGLTQRELQIFDINRHKWIYIYMDRKREREKIQLLG